MSDLEFDKNLNKISDTIRNLMITATIEENTDKLSKITCMVEGCHAAIITSLVMFPIVAKDKKKAEILLEKSLDLFAVKIGITLDVMREKMPHLREFIPEASKSQEEVTKEIEEMIDNA